MLLRVLIGLSLAFRLSAAGSVALSATTVTGTAKSTILKLVLRNQGSTGLTVLTGLYAGHAHPAANFTYTVELNRGRPMKLECWTCSPSIIGGTLGAYTVQLKPNATWETSIPLSDYWYGNQKHLCTEQAQAGELTVALQGGSWQTQVKSPTAYWTGTVSTTIHFTCAVVVKSPDVGTPGPPVTKKKSTRN